MRRSRAAQRGTVGEGLLALQTLAGLVLTLVIAAIAVRHDAAQVGWRKYVGVRALWAVYSIDALVAGGLYIALTLGATAGWHLLASHDVVASRSTVGPWSLVLNAVTCGLGSLPLLGRRFPAVSKRLTALRADCITTIQCKVVRKESLYHETVAEPALAMYEPALLGRKVRQWARNSKLSVNKQNQIHKAATANNVDNRLTLCSHLYMEKGGPAFLEQLIKGAPEDPGGAQAAAS